MIGKIDKKYIHMLIAVLLSALVMLFLPASNGLTESGVKALAITLFTVYMWIFIGVDWVSMLVIFLYVLFGVIDSSSIFKATFGSWMVPFIIMTSCLNIMLSESGFLSRIVKWFISRKAVQGRPWMFSFYIHLRYSLFPCFQVLWLTRSLCCP